MIIWTGSVGPTLYSRGRSSLFSNRFIVCIGVSTPLKKTPPSLSCQAPLKSANYPLFRQSQLYIGFSWNPPPLPPVKLGLSHEPPKYQSFSSWNPSYLLKVTKFLVKISQFEFLVTTEQRILLYKLFLSLNIPVFNLFFVKKLQGPLKKSHPASSDSPLKTEVLSSPPF